MPDPLSVQIRHAAPTDVEQLVSFQIAMAAETESKSLNAATLRGGVSHLLDHPDEGFYLLAESTGDDPTAAVCVGSLMATYEWSDWRNGRFWWIQSVYVAPGFRRRGVYTALHARIRGMARAAEGCCGLRLYVERENAAAQATYRSLDMDETRYLLFEELFEEQSGKGG